jgi:RNA binding activity-knot of a chromodomain
MKKTLPLLILLFSTFTSIAQSKSGFKNTWVFMVGVLEWKDHKNFASFDKTNRIDAEIVKFFQQNGLPNAKVLKTFSTLHYVHYDGYDKKWDEWVSPDLIKKLR